MFFLIAICLNSLNLIPEPKEVTINDGQFTIKPTTGIYYDSSVEGLLDVINYAAKIIRISTGYSFQYKNSTSNDQINFVKSTSPLGAEGYILTVTTDAVTITSTTTTGFLYGYETFLQLLPAEIYSKQTVNGIDWTSPCVKIHDSPRFEWRGLLLDVSRHFYSIDSLKALINSMAHSKLNCIHLHLNDDQGWRIEIKKYPRLTSCGSVSSGRPKPWFRKENDNIQYGPFFYTQDEVKELDKYARIRGVSIVPEIDMPGHAIGGLTGYPELSCTGGPFETSWNMEPPPETFCIGNDRTIPFLSDVLDEVMELFESKYIHIGGDECQTVRWEECPKCQKLYKELNLTNYKQLQYWFTEKMIEHIREKGHIAIGYDEIVNEHLSKDVMVMGWHRQKGINAANNGYKVVMCPSDMIYICQYQFTVPDIFEYAVFGYKTLYLCYDFNPTDGVREDSVSNILGLQAAMWTEWVWGGDFDLFWKTYPRLIAIADSGWVENDKRDFNRFLRSYIRKHRSRLSEAQIISAPAGQAQNLFWNKNDIGSDWVTKEWKLGSSSLSIKGRYEVAFILLRGESGINIKNVNLKIDGKVIAQSTQEGQATWNDNQVNHFVMQTSEDVSGKEVSLFADIKRIDDNESEGEIVLYYTK